MANEKRLIDANELIRFCDNEINKYEDALNKWEKDYVKAIRVAKKIIRVFPTVDAVEVVHGRWVDHMVRDWRCSECGKRVPRQVHFDGYCYDDKLNYCPNCGARMDGDGNG